MNTGMNNIHVNPNFVPKYVPKIHLNPSFVHAKKLDNYLNSHSENYVPEPVYENVNQCRDNYAYAPNTSSFLPCNTPIENSTTHCQNYSDEYSNFTRTETTIKNSDVYFQNYLDKCSNVAGTDKMDTFSINSQSVHKSKPQDKSGKFFSTKYLTSHNLDTQDTYRTNEASSLNQHISVAQKPINKSVIMGQRMIKNYHVIPSKAIYSIDHRMSKNVLPNLVSTNSGGSFLLSKPSFTVQNKIVKDILPNNSSSSKMNTLQNLSSILPVQSANSINQNINGLSSFCYNNAKDELPMTESCKTPSKTGNSIFCQMHNDEIYKTPFKSRISEPCGSVSISPKHSPTFDSHSTFLKSSMKLIRRDTLRKSAKFIREDILVKKRKYAVKTKTKLIRRNSSSSNYPTFNHVSKLSKLRKSFKLKKGTLLKAREKMISHRFIRPTTNRPVFQKESKFNTKYKFVKDGILVSRFKVNRKPHQRAIIFSSPSKSNNSKSTWSLKFRRNLKKSDKFINISGNLYKSTATSLQKQDVSPKSRKPKTKTFSSKIKVKKFSFRNSKFVYKRQNSAKLESGTLIEIVRRKKLAHFKRVNDYCFFYNKYGKCKKQNKGCPFIHDPSKVAICTRFLQGSCTETCCPFSHMMDKSKMPICSHFQDGLCSKENCQYRHVRVNPKAPVCKNFLKGFCPHGEECKKKHILICEDFNKDGTCPRGKKCPLSHRNPKVKATKKSKLNTIVSSSKRKKPKTKTGVLGLICEKIKVTDNKIAASSSNRYFDSPDDGENLRSGQSEFSTSQDLNAFELEQKRERILRKLESVKKNYNVGLEDIVEINDHRRSSQKLDVPEDSMAENDAVSSQKLSPFKPQYFPLPDVMPSFIPLVMPEHEA